MKSLVFILVVVTGMNALGQGPNFFLGAGATTSWDDPDNWSQGILPINSWIHPNAWDDHDFYGFELSPGDASDDGPIGNNNAMFNTEGTTNVIDSSVHAKAYGVRVGLDGASNTLLITGGQLDIGIDATAPANANQAGWFLDVGRGFNRDPSATPNPKATVIMSGGIVNTGLVKIPEQFVDASVDPAPDPQNNYHTEPISGEFIMTGGTLNTRKINVGQFVGHGNAVFRGEAVINLFSNVPGDPANGGFLEMRQDWFIAGQPIDAIGDAHIDISENAIFTMTGHKDQFIVSPDASEVARYQGYIDAGELTADNGTDVPTIYFDGSRTIKLCALDADFDGDCDTDEDDLMTWQANYGMTGVAGDLKALGDADNDGDVDGADFLELQIEYGVGVDSEIPLTTLVTLPEPASIWLLTLFGIAASTIRRGFPRVESENCHDDPRG